MGTCTINIMDRISGAWANNEPLGILCIDFVKAFDSVEHEFIRNVLKLFHYGERFIGMVMTLLNARKARVNTGEGFTDTFDIKRGTPQGDRTSPFIFILCIEVLLIKIAEMDGNGINSCNFIKNWINGRGLDTWNINNECFADDLTILFKMSLEGLNNILAVMENFKTISGLELNVKKTQLMVAGTEQYGVGDTVAGIEVVSSVKILGVKIDRKLEKLNENWYEKINRVRRLAQFWSLQNLTICGRILVAKTFLLSQVIFLMDTLPLNIADGNTINEIIAVHS